MDDVSIGGYAVSRANNALAALLPLAAAYPFDALEQGGTVRFVRRAGGTSATLPLEEAVPPSSGGDPVQVERAPDYELLDAVSVTYRDPERSYQEGTQRDSRYEGASQNVADVRTPVVLTADAARQLATRLLWESWANRTTVKLTVSDRWRWAQPGVSVIMPVGGTAQPVRITRTTRGVSGQIEWTGTVEDPYIYEATDTGASAPTVDVQPPSFGITTGYCFNSPILRPEDSDSAYSWTMDSDAAGWRGAQLYRSTDYGLSYRLTGPASSKNTTGIVGAVLASGPCDLWDRVNTLPIVLLYSGHQLSSVTEEQALMGLNAFWVGAADGSHGEIINAATVTLTAPGQYTLSNLLRGRRATEHEVGLHAADDVVVFLEANVYHTADYSLADLGSLATFKAVSAYGSLLGTPTAWYFTNTCERARPRSPVHPVATRDGGNNLSLSWTRRTRGRASIMGYGPQALDEVTEAYEVDVIVGGVVKRTIATSAPSCTYSAAEQTADGITPGAAVRVKIHQLSADVGRGHPGDYTV
jgi:hypothetical protein